MTPSSTAPSTAPSTRRSSSLLRLLASTGALLACAALAACGTRLTPTVAQVSGRSVEVVEAGAGDATVVFEAGLGDDWARWDKVAAEVAGRAQVFAYSRPGYGDSDPSGAPRTATRIVEDLRALLAARGFAPPYILVGHSFGGTYMELFAKAHPEEVTALVLVDSPETMMDPANLVQFLKGLSDIALANQFIVATSHRAVVREFTHDSVHIDLGVSR